MANIRRLELPVTSEWQGIELLVLVNGCLPVKIFDFFFLVLSILNLAESSLSLLKYRAYIDITIVAIIVS